MTEVSIRTEYITLGQFLKLADIISTGGEAKPFLQENPIMVNGEQDQRRGRKLYDGDEVSISGSGTYRIKRNSNQ